MNCKKGDWKTQNSWKYKLQGASVWKRMVSKIKKKAFQLQIDIFHVQFNKLNHLKSKLRTHLFSHFPNFTMKMKSDYSPETKILKKKISLKLI